MLQMRAFDASPATRVPRGESSGPGVRLGLAASLACELARLAACNTRESPAPAAGASPPRAGLVTGLRALAPSAVVVLVDVDVALG